MKNKTNKNLAEVFHFNLYGKREEKYNFLNQNSISTLEWNKLQPNEPNFFFVPKNFDIINQYEKGFKIDVVFRENIVGIETVRDAITLHFNSDSLKNVINDFLSLTEIEIAKKYNIADARDWKISRAKEDVKLNIDNKNVWQTINYRPFDLRKTFYSGKQNGFVCNGRYNVMKHMLKPNITLVFERQAQIGNFTNIFISNKVVECHIQGTMFSKSSIAPLYLYPETTTQQTIGQTTERTPNLNSEIVKQIEEKLGLPFVPEKDLTGFKNLSGLANTFAPIDILDYIYAVLHSPTYREKYKEFLKIDFPRVPYPQTLSKFRTLTKLGAELRQIHLLESPIVERYITQYPIDGDNVVNKINFAKVSNFGKVFINETQYFANVPEIAWNFYIGGYQPAQKWLKDRKNRKLEFEDILHYQKIIVALSETDRIMKEIDKIEIE